MRSFVHLSIVIKLCCSLLLCACGQQTPEQAIIAQLQRAEEAIVARDADALRNTMTSESWLMGEEVLKLAQSGEEKVLRALPPTKLKGVIALRNRVSPARLKVMSREDYAIWRIDQGMVYALSDYGVYPMSVRIKDDVANVQLGIEVVPESPGRRVRIRRGGGAVRTISAVVNLAAAAAEKNLEAIPGFEIGYRNLNGYWYRDVTLDSDYWSQYYKEYADSKGITLPDLLMEMEREEFGTIRDDLWAKPK